MAMTRPKPNVGYSTGFWQGLLFGVFVASILWFCILALALLLVV